MHPLLKQAFDLHRRGKLAEAGRAYSEVLRAQPNDFDANHLLGVLALQMGRAAQGIDLITRALAVNPRSVEALNNLGKGLDAAGRSEEALTQFARALEIKPDFADAYVNRGLLLGRLGRDAEAIGDFERLLQLDPRSAEAHGNRGLALIKLRRVDEARASLERAIELQPDTPEAHNGLGMVLRELGRTEDAVAAYDRAIALRPAFAEAHNNRATALRELGKLDEALQSYNAALAVQPDAADVAFNRAQCLLAMGRHAEGWRDYEARTRKSPPIGVRAIACPLWLGDAPIAGKTILLHWEQGYGDSIQFARYAKSLEAMGARVLLSVQAPLAGLLQSLGTGIRIIGPHDAPEDVDFHCPLMSLPLAFGTTADNTPAETPYLHAAPNRSEIWEAKLGAKTKPRVGLVWSGSVTHANDARRSISLAAMLNLANDRIETISLQKDLRVGDSEILAQRQDIRRLGEQIGDFADTAALCAAMDLIITVDTSMAHLAGALGKPVWILLPSNPDWRWGHIGSTTPWYPTARLFRQSQAGDWAGAINEARAAIDGQFGG